MFKPTHSFIPDCEKLRFVLDIETLAMDPKAAVIDIALVEVLGNGRFFSGQIKPSWYEKYSSYTDKTAFSVNPETVDWHNSKNPGYLSMLEQRGEAGTTIVGRLFDFLVDLQTLEQKQVVIMTQGTDFDIPIISNLFKQVACSVPWHYRNVRDLRTLQNLTPQLKYVAGNHTALEDARHSADHLMKQASASIDINFYLFGAS